MANYISEKDKASAIEMPQQEYIPWLWIDGQSVGYIPVNKRQYKNKIIDMQSTFYHNSKGESVFTNKTNNSVIDKNNQMYILGTQKITPYLMQEGSFLIPPYVDTVQGRKPRFTAFYQLGFPNLVIKKIWVGEDLIKEFSNNVAQNGVFNVNTEKYKGKLEIAQGKQLQTITSPVEKIVTNYVNTELSSHINTSSLYFGGEWEIDSFAKEIEIVLQLPNGLVSNGYENVKYEFMAYYKLYDDDIAHDICFDGMDYYTREGEFSTIYGSSTLAKQELFFTAHATLSLNDYQEFKAHGAKSIKVVVGWRCKSQSTTIQQTVNEKMSVKLLYIQTKSFDPNKSSKPAGVLDDGGSAGLISRLAQEDYNEVNTCNLALDLNNDVVVKDKSDIISDTEIKKVSVLVSACCRTWNRNTKTWSSTKQVTSNPACWALEVLTSTLHQISKYNDNEIDLASFGVWAEFCEDNGFTFDYVIKENKSKSAILDLICTAGRGVIYNDVITGKLTCAIDCKKTEVLNVYNSQNSINVSMNKEFSRAIDGVKVNFINKDADYNEDSVTIMRNGVTKTSTSVMQEISLEGVTSYDNVVKHVRYLMAGWNLRQKTVSVDVGLEALYYPLMSRIQLQTDALKVGISSGVIESIEGDDNIYTALNLRDAVEFEEGKRYGVIINCYTGNKTTPLCLEVTGHGRTKRVNIRDGFAVNNMLIIEPNCIFSFGELTDDGKFSKITSDFLLMKKSTSEAGFTLDLVEYNDAVYEATGAIPEYISNITETKRKVITKEETYVIESPDKPVISSCVADRDGIKVKLASLEKNGIKNVIRSVIYEISYDSGQTWETFSSTIDGNAEYRFNEEKGRYLEVGDLQSYRIKVTVLNTEGASAESDGVTVDTSNYGTYLIAEPKIETRVNGRNVTLLLSENETASGGIKRTFYGKAQYKVEIKRTQSGMQDAEWQKPAIAKDPYASEDNYKDGDGFVVADNMFQQVLPLAGQNADNPLPVDTSYQYRITSFCKETGIENSEKKTVNVIALGTSVKDIVANAITTNKLAEGCVVRDKIHANSITAEKLDLDDITAVLVRAGQITSDKIQAVKNPTTNKIDSYWDLISGEFRIGNDINKEDTTTLQPKEGDDGTGAAFLHFNGQSLGISMTNFVMTSVSTLLKGLVKFIDKDDGSVLLSANPQDTVEDGEDTPANTVKINGNLEVTGGVNTHGQDFNPIGTMLMFASTNAPSGYLLCHGQAVSRTTYSELFAVIGTSYGAGDGSSTFNVPDMQARFPRGPTPNNPVGAKGGEDTHVITANEMPSHTHTTPSHTHTGTISKDNGHSHDIYHDPIWLMRGGNPSWTLKESGESLSTSNSGAHTHTLTIDSGGGGTSGSTGGGGAHNNIPQFTAVEYIIKAK